MLMLIIWTDERKQSSFDIFFNRCCFLCVRGRSLETDTVHSAFGRISNYPEWYSSKIPLFIWESFIFKIFSNILKENKACSYHCYTLPHQKWSCLTFSTFSRPLRIP